MPQEDVTWIIVLEALLHDIGKPIQRYARRGITSDKCHKNAAGILAELSERVGSQKHEDYSQAYISLLLDRLGIEYSSGPSRWLREADRIAAGERKARMEVAGREAEILNMYRKELGQGGILSIPGQYGPEYTPMLSPLWLLNEIGYNQLIDPCMSDLDLLESLKKSKFIEAYRDPLGQGQEHLRALIRSVVKAKAWFPVLPITEENVGKDRIKLMRYGEALSRSDYGCVVGELWILLESISRIYSRAPGMGLVETLERGLSTSILLVPSAVWGSILPDISLYSHSRLVAAYTNALYRGRGRFRLLQVDVNGIQNFIAAPVSASAATRVLRGRSLLVQLVADTILERIIRELGGTRLSYIVREGGTITLILPDISGFEEKAKSVERELLKALAMDLDWKLWVTLAYTRAISPGDLGDNVIDALERISRELSGELAAKKSLSGTLKAEIYKEIHGGCNPCWDQIEDLDALTREPIVKVDKSRLIIDENSQDYAARLSGGKLEPGDAISGLTHLSLAVGSAARGPSMVISIYPRGDNPGDAIERLASDIGKGRLYYNRYRIKLDCENMNKPMDVSIAIVPLPRLGGLHLVVSIPESGGSIEEVYWCTVKSILRKLRDLGLRDARVIIRRVQALEKFIPRDRRLADLIASEVAELAISGVEVVFDHLMANFMHPTDGEGDPLELDKMVRGAEAGGLLSVVKLDGDKAGDILVAYSITPSRQASLSDFLNLAFSIVPNMKSVVESAGGQGGAGWRNRVALLYGGGDDVVFYGGLDASLRYLREIKESVSGILEPLSLTAGLAMDRVKTPILLLYSLAVDAMEDSKEKSRGTLATNIDVDNMYIQCVDAPRRGRGIWLRHEGSSTYAQANTLDKLLEIVDKLTVNGDSLRSTLFHRVVLLSRMADSSDPVERARAYVAYAYLWARRRKDMDELNNALGGILPVIGDTDTQDDMDTVLHKLLEISNLLNIIHILHRFM